MAASYHKAVPNGKFVVMNPSSACGILDNVQGDFTTKQNASIWEFCRNILGNFDGRETDNIYIVDAAIAIDNLYGFNSANERALAKPYADYSGSENIAIQAGNPHPYLNYPTMGLSSAAFTQKYR